MRGIFLFSLFFLHSYQLTYGNDYEFVTRDRVWRKKVFSFSTHLLITKLHLVTTSGRNLIYRRRIHFILMSDYLQKIVQFHKLRHACKRSKKSNGTFKHNNGKMSNLDGFHGWPLRERKFLSISVKMKVIASHL